eukprot:m.63103 g.63103  ORF g.63103 m.63103 type:complete len:453 (+) comp8132_c0_seq2:35-1393(+)
MSGLASIFKRQPKRARTESDNVPAAPPRSFAAWNCNGLPKRMCSSDAGILPRKEHTTEYPVQLYFTAMSSHTHMPYPSYPCSYKYTHTRARAHVHVLTQHRMTVIVLHMHIGLETDSDSIRDFLTRENPDIIGLTETWLRGAPGNQAKVRPGKGSLVPSKMDADDRDCHAMRTALTGPRAVFDDYRAYLSCHASRRASGCALLIKRTVQRPNRVRFTLPPWENEEGSTPGTAGCHHPSGRIILAEWDAFDVLLTYTPNHGTRDTWIRRQEWDEKLTHWLQTRTTSDTRPKPLIYLGDLNCAPTDADLSHPDWFKDQFTKDKSSNEPLPEAQAGQPGCAPVERERFHTMLEAGDLIDAYRLLNPPVPNPGPAGSSAERAWVAGPYFTWRGKPSAEGSHPARYENKGMRIDHLLVSSCLKSRVQEAKICGQGASAADASFMGSDHCPMLLRLSE